MGAITNHLCLGMCAVYSFFGVTLAISPEFFWGPDSVASYWTAMDESGVWFGRALGFFMTAITSSPYWAGMPKDVLAKVYLPCNAYFAALFLQASFLLKSTGPAPQNLLPFNMWWTQLPIAAAFLVMNVIAVGEKPSKAKRK